MNNMGLQQYKSVDLSASVQTASAHQLIAMLFRGALESLAIAKGAIERNQIELRTEKLNKTIDILVNLRAALDEEKGGDLSRNLAQLYEYMTQQLILANRLNNSDKVDEVTSLLQEISAGWADIPPEHHDR